ncbi:hypothetical protein J1P26_21865 [Neobacillus sp. MM2021_6]|uniref:hypothetical protein n=1 Tax=Bacillaceae TaxID=186817 RepID=UPI0014094203|nr:MULTISPECIES: hypothetical protein [Bacillaceae]MBO0962354.1 hypothetical protein [Neobacillus sp. MM2021_6]NHC20837.1 hypothetical protein [Bacillus sp. MM2020_4]
MTSFRVQLNLDKESRVFITIKSNAKANALNYLQTNKWVKDEDLEKYHNMDKVISFQIYDED